MNKPCLSINDVAKVYVTANVPVHQKYTKPSSQNYKIQELVKSKLNL